MAIASIHEGADPPENSPRLINTWPCHPFRRRQVRRCRAGGHLFHRRHHEGEPREDTRHGAGRAQCGRGTDTGHFPAFIHHRLRLRAAAAEERGHGGSDRPGGRIQGGAGDHRGPDTRHPLPAMIAELFLALLLGVLAGIITG